MIIADIETKLMKLQDIDDYAKREKELGKIAFNILCDIYRKKSKPQKENLIEELEDVIFN